VRFVAAIPLMGLGMLFASEFLETPGAVTYGLQGGAMALLAWMVWYLLARMFPAHVKAIREQQNDFLVALKEERIEARGILNAFLGALQDERAETKEALRVFQESLRELIDVIRSVD